MPQLFYSFFFRNNLQLNFVTSWMVFRLLFNICNNSLLFAYSIPVNVLQMIWRRLQCVCREMYRLTRHDPRVGHRMLASSFGGIIIATFRIRDTRMYACRMRPITHWMNTRVVSVVQPQPNLVTSVGNFPTAIPGDAALHFINTVSVPNDLSCLYRTQS